MSDDAGVVADEVVLRGQPDRVVTRFFVPGREDVGPGDSRAVAVFERVMGLDDQAVARSLAELERHFSHRHRSLRSVFHRHAHLLTSRLEPGSGLSLDRLLLLGASFTQEYALEGAALCNPSAVLHPQQLDDARTRFILSVRGIGEGHRSSIGFRSGSIGPDGRVEIERPGSFPELGEVHRGPYQRSLFHAEFADSDEHRDNAMFVLEHLATVFDDAELGHMIERLKADESTRSRIHESAALLDQLADSSYRVVFDPAIELSERVLFPQAHAEHQGMEDARFVRFVDDDGTITYYATYTAFDGLRARVHLIETQDFAIFRVSPMSGRPASGKGMALFPRRLEGRFVALSRADREANSIAFSDDIRCWGDSETIQVPHQPWEVLQLGNCGSPIELDQGWLVLTHGVGPMRTYSIGALLLDLDDPRRVLARSPQPIVVPSERHRDGYVPNVVYSCGGFVHAGRLLLPYGVADQAIVIETLELDELLASLVSD